MTISTSLMFLGQAEDALTLYASVFDNAKIGLIDRYPEGDMKGKIMQALLSLGDHNIIL